jgi:hypothetical protein
MKNAKKLLSTLLALLLVFSALSTGMTALAAEEDGGTSRAITALSVGGKPIDLAAFPKEYSNLNCNKKSVKIKWSLGEGWHLVSAWVIGAKPNSYEISNGEAVKLPKGKAISVHIKAVTDSEENYDEKYYEIQLHYGKPKLLPETLWVGSYPVNVKTDGLDEVEPVSLKSSNPKVLGVVKMGGVLASGELKPKKAGKSTVTATVLINGEKKKFKATYVVKKYPNALKELKVGADQVNLKKNKFRATLKLKKKKVKVTFKAAKGWKVKKCTGCDSDTYGDEMFKFKSGGTVAVPTGLDSEGEYPNWVYLTIVLTNKKKESFTYELGMRCVTG